MRPTIGRAAALAACFVASSGAWGQERSCHVDGIDTPVTCVTLAVPRDYDAPDGDTLALTAVVIPAITARPAPDPLFVFSGGPGQAASDSAGMPVLSLVRRERDVVLFDVRGTGLSGPLECAAPNATAEASGDEQPAILALEVQRETAARCARDLGDRVRYHTDREIGEDIERLRVARGYARINLWGGSFGTRVAQHYVRAYGDHVRAVVLDSVTPVATSIFVSSARAPDVSLDKLFAACAADDECAGAFPDLRVQFERLLASVSATPASAFVMNPLTGRNDRVAVDRLFLSNAVRLALYFRTTAEVLPFAIHAAAAGNWTPFVGVYGLSSDEIRIALGLQFSVLCAEDWPIGRDAGVQARSGELLGDGFYELFARACEVWPPASVPPAMLEPFSSTVPALAISGEFDPITPPELAEQAMRQFATSVHVVVPNGFHGNSADPCVMRLIASFLADPSTGGRDHACVAPTPLRFFTGPSS